MKKYHPFQHTMHYQDVTLFHTIFGISKKKAITAVKHASLAKFIKRTHLKKSVWQKQRQLWKNVLVVKILAQQNKKKTIWRKKTTTSKIHIKAPDLKCLSQTDDCLEMNILCSSISINAVDFLTLRFTTKVESIRGMLYILFCF